MNLGFNCIGGCKYDLDDECFDFTAKTLEAFEPKLYEIIDTVENDPMIRKRTMGVGILTRGGRDYAT